MSLGTWIVAVLCIAGVAVAGASIFPVLRAMRRLKTHLNRLSDNQLMRTLNALPAAVSRLSLAASKVAPLGERIRRAVRSTKASIGAISLALK